MASETTRYNLDEILYREDGYRWLPEARLPYCQTTRHYLPVRHDISKHQIRLFSTGMLFTIISQLAPLPATELAGKHTHKQTHTHAHVYALAHCSWVGLRGKSTSEAVHHLTNKCSYWFLSRPWVIRSSRCLIHIQIKRDGKVILWGAKITLCSNLTRLLTLCLLWSHPNRLFKHEVHGPYVSELLIIVTGVSKLECSVSIFRVNQSNNYLEC